MAGWRRIRLGAIPALVALALSGRASAADGRHRYTVTVAKDLNRLQVRACFTEPAPGVLVAHSHRIPKDMAGLRVVAGGGPLPSPQTGQRRIRVPDEVECLAYSVDLAAAARRSLHAEVQQVPGGLVASPRQWLWFPYRRGRRQDLDLTFRLPAGVRAAGPWPTAGSEGTTYRLGQRPYRWPTRVAIGRFPERVLEVGGARIRVSMLRGSPEVDRPGLLDWIREGAQALTRVYGRFPVPRAHILVVPVARGGEPVPWGEVQRGGGEAVHLYIDQRRPLSEFRSDWTLAHELSHLLHPATDYDAPWLYEGLASYYQNVIRARSGQLTAEQAWRKLHRGFRRGRRNTDPDQTLAQVAQAMEGHPDYMRVYWSGAALFLRADWQLRAEEDGTRSLDTVLEGLARCCLPSRRRWDPDELLRRLDSLADRPVFTELGQRYAPATAFPDLTRVYARLGLWAQGQELRLIDRAPETDLRRSIMAGPGKRRRGNGPPAHRKRSVP